MKSVGILLLLTVLELHAHAKNITVEFSVPTLKLELSSTKNVSLLYSDPLSENGTMVFTYQVGNDISFHQDPEIVKSLSDILLAVGDNSSLVSLEAVKAGSIIIGVASNSTQFKGVEQTFTRVSVVHSKPLETIIIVIGWIYFVAWSISFYPQVYINWRRKSVIGLNFDFLAYNLTGFTAYGIFNIGMYWIPEIKDEYFAKNPRGVNPVLLNDVFFTLHAIVLTSVTIIQTFIYERGDQRLSRICWLILGGSSLFAFITLFLAVGKVITWLSYVYYFSYIKLGVTLIKYVPQALMNYRRKSTDGWSIGNVLLDCTGGTLSLLQMFLLSYNNDDWSSIFGDPTKFGLGAFSIMFDILFMVQHYVLYRNTRNDYTLISQE